MTSVRVLRGTRPSSDDLNMSGLADKKAKEAVADAIRAVEKQTSAEVVVAVRPHAASYRHADYLVGALTAFTTLLVLLFHPREFAVEMMPVDVLVAFVLGAVVSAQVAPLRRIFLGRRAMQENAARAARAAFVDLGVSRTTGRSGILVFVSAFERHVEVVADIGVDTSALGVAWPEIVGKLNAALRQGGATANAFVEALLAMGPVLGRRLPRAHDDVNELPDEVA